MGKTKVPKQADVGQPRTKVLERTDQTSSRQSWHLWNTFAARARPSTAFYRTNFSGFGFLSGTLAPFFGAAREQGKGLGRWGHSRRGARSISRHTLLVEHHVVLQPWSTGHLSLRIHPSNIHPDTRNLRVLLLPSHRSHRIRHNMALLLLRPSTASDDNDDRTPKYGNQQHDHERCQSGN